MIRGNTQERTTVILYLLTSTLAIPTMISAFAPLYLAFGLFILLAFATLRLSLGKSKEHGSHVTT